MAKYRVKVSGAIGDTPHKPGDILDVPATQGDRWVAAGIAEKVAQPRRSFDEMRDDVEREV